MTESHVRNDRDAEMTQTLPGQIQTNHPSVNSCGVRIYGGLLSDLWCAVKICHRVEYSTSVAAICTSATTLS